MNGFVLVVDDEPGVLATICDALDLGGHACLGIAQPLDLRRVEFRRCPDVIVLDIMLEGPRSGVEMARELRERLGARMVGASASPQMAQLARDSALFDAVIDKPFDVFEFLDLIARLVANPERADGVV